MDNLARVLDFIKLPPKYLFLILVTASLLLFLPLDVLVKIGLASIVKELRPLIALVWFVTTIFLLVYGIYAISRQGSKWVHNAM